MNVEALSPPANRASDHRLAPRVVQGRDEELERAIARDELTVLFQPQIEPLTGRVVGIEALARWVGEPDTEALFARAGRHGLAERLSRVVQRKALRLAGAWQGERARLRLSINVIAADLMRDGYTSWLLDEAAEVGFNPRRLTVEITESSLIADQKLAAERLRRLRNVGVQVAIDDFGTGYSSLAYLASLPLDAIKIDRAMIADLVGGSRDRIVVQAMIRLARELGLKVIVEGVESRAQLALVAEWGCDLYQGFLSAGALDEKELERFVAATLAVAA